MAMSIVRALVTIKRSMALANAQFTDVTGVDGATADAICPRGRRSPAGDWDDQFAIDTFQTGSGTSTNMNVNEVLAALAERHLAGVGVHPNDDVNASQSTNDVFPSAVRVAVLIEIRMCSCRASTCCTTRSPIVPRHSPMWSRRDEPTSWTHRPSSSDRSSAGTRRRSPRRGERLAETCVRVAALPLGGTATGNGLNAPSGVAAIAIADIARIDRARGACDGQPIRVQASPDALVELSGQLRVTATGMFKIANDIRLLASGPHTGLAEIRIPELQPGSSIMPGKVNPVLCEVVTQVAAQVVGHDAAIGFRGESGHARDEHLSARHRRQPPVVHLAARSLRCRFRFPWCSGSKPTGTAVEHSPKPVPQSPPP